MPKIRLDTLLIDQNFFDSKQKAQAAVMGKIVKVDDKIIDKPGTMIKEDAVITLTAELDSKYVSRGGFKLEKAINEFQPIINGNIFLDIGASTGGFTDCLLKNGAKFVYAIDVGYGQINWSIRQNESVKVIERCNARNLTGAELYTENQPKANAAVMDVSFISIEKIIPNLIAELLDKDFFIIALVKPQFEAGKENLKKGVVISADVHKKVLINFAKFCQKNNLDLRKITYSPIKGPSGNIEFLAYIQPTQVIESTIIDTEDSEVDENSIDEKVMTKILSVVETAHKSLKD